MENEKLKKSNCLIQAIKVRMVYKGSSIGFDFNSPSKWPSFYVDTYRGRHRFRRKIYRNKNKSTLLFIGYNIIEQIPKKRNSDTSI